MFEKIPTVVHFNETALWLEIAIPIDTALLTELKGVRLNAIGRTVQEELL